MRHARCPVADRVEARAVDIGERRVGVRLVNEHPQLVRSVRPKRLVQLLQRTRRVQVPARRTPRGRDLHHGNLSLVQNVGVQRMGVPVDVGHREVRCRSKLSMHAGPEGQREKESHEFVHEK